MIRLLVQATMAGVIAALLLVQLQQAQELLAWELLLFALLVWQLRELPGRTDVFPPPLFEFERPRKARTPRSVSTAELNAIDALSGYLSPERRLRPMLRQLAVHRLRRHGLTLESAGGVGRLGEEGWRWLVSDSDDVPSVEDLEDLVARLEDL